MVAAALAATAALAAPSLAAAHDGHGSSGHGGNGHGSAAVVQTDKGAVRGLVKPYVREFRGIPYAAAPSGSRRWAEPQPVARWQGVRDASAYPANCPQDASGDPGFEQQSTNEDCLGLNVVTPKSAPRDAPVFVFIHGGGYRVGHATFETMQRFVQKTGAVAVTMNYRLGVLGFLDVRKFGDGAGNFGVLDQQASLRWVQRNIDRFGGDPRNVTIAGQSAGAGSVCAQLASPGARGLFDAAIIESGGNSCNATRTKEVAQQEGSTFATALGCPEGAGQVACLRSRSVQELLAAQGSVRVSGGPEIDGDVLPGSMQELFTTGRFNRVPVIAGTNSSDSSGNACSTQTFSQQLARWIPVYRYEFADETAPPLPGRDVSIAGRGAQHSAELMYLYQFNGYTASFDPDQQDLSDAMTLYWSQFVHEGDPNADDLPAWPRFTSRSQSVIRFTKTAIGATTDFAQRYACV